MRTLWIAALICGAARLIAPPQPSAPSTAARSPTEPAGPAPGVTVILGGPPPMERSRARPVMPEGVYLYETVNCTARAHVQASGVPTSVEVTGCAEPFRTWAANAALASRFYPYAVEGVPTSFSFTYRYHFQAP